MDLLPVSREEKIAALKREINMRKHVYAGRVAERKMSQDKADKEISIMVAILADYESPQ